MDRPLINAYLELSRKLPEYLKFSDDWYIYGYYLRNDIIRIAVKTPSGEVILNDKTNEFPSDTLAASIILLL